MRGLQFFNKMFCKEIFQKICQKFVCCAEPIKKNLQRKSLTVGLNSRTPPLCRKPPPRKFTCEYIRTFSASRGRSYMSTAFLRKLRVVYYKATTLLRRWSTIDFFLILLFLIQLVLVPIPKRICDEFSL